MTNIPDGPIDLHAHYVARSAFTAVPGNAIEDESDGVRLTINGRPYGSVERSLVDAERQIADMDAMGIVHSVVSPPPFLFRYGDDAGFATEFAAAQNEGIGALINAHPEHFSGLAAVPLQVPETAVRMLSQAVEHLGLAGVEIGTNVAGRDLDDPALDPFWRQAADLNVPVFIHPSDVRAIPDGTPYYLRNLTGNLVETAYCLTRLIYGGVLARYPSLRILAAHGGGFLPYTIGRLDHGYEVRPECRAALAEPPSHYFSQLYFDTITHGAPALRYLVDLVGAERVTLGSDYPFDMGEPQPLGQLDPFDNVTRKQIASRTPHRLLERTDSARGDQ